jgi:hypothetical protein
VGASNHFVSAALSDGSSSSRSLLPNPQRGPVSLRRQMAEPKKGYPRPLGGDRRHPSIPLGRTLRAKNTYSPIKLADLCGLGRSRSRPPLGKIWDIVRCRSLTSRRPCAPDGADSGSFECACREARPRGESHPHLGRLSARGACWCPARPRERRTLLSGSVSHDGRRSQARDPHRSRP